MIKPLHLCALLLGFAFCKPIFAQEDIVAQFSAQKNEEAVHLTWVITQGNSCNGIEIERSSDGLHFEIVGRIDGICGGFGSAQRFDYTDLMPLRNRNNFYRLSSRSEVISDTIAIEVVVIGAANYVLRPNPIADMGTLYFENLRFETHQLTVYDPAGTIVQTQSSSLSHFDLVGSDLQNGLYFFRIQGSDGAITASGRLLIRH